MSRTTDFSIIPSEKRHESDQPSSCQDYISDLQDDVLSQILSRLPIKDAVKTCVLSKDWEFKWTLIYNVKIDAKELSRTWRKETKIVDIVERVLLHVQNLKNFHLQCSCSRKYVAGRISTLISGILRRGVKCLKLVMSGNSDFFLPRSLLNCTSIRKLDLRFSALCSLRVPKMNYFPCLKSMYLKQVKFLIESSGTGTLIFSFPVLKVLVLDDCKWVKVKFVEFHAPLLCKFTSISNEFEDKKDYDYSIKVIGATISDLLISGGYPENIIMIGSTVASVTVHAYFVHLLGDCGLQVRKLLRETPNMKSACLGYVLLAMRQTKLQLPLPRFCMLEELEIHPLDCADGLLELLHAAPFLKSLEINMGFDVANYDYDLVVTVPSCVVHHLEEVTIYYGETCEFNFLFEKFLLANGSQLKTVFIKNNED